MCIKPPGFGDLIEVFRPGYQHWAIYVGDGYVIHLTAGAGSSSLMSVLYDSALVKKERLSDVVGNDVYRVNNLLDDEYEPRDTNLLLKKAHSLVGQTLPFSVFSRNCEHFVTDLRYGKSTSSQVAVIGGLAVLGVGLLALTTGLFSKSEKRSKTNSVHFFD
uniref:Phospholipase A and acyltransferase 4 n=1 Tax=Astyanax mexicanus TaxID=7994 RepID=A0A8B9JYY2_ASTMX